MSQTEFVVVANRLPVDQGDDGAWRTSPGGLVTALEPVVRARKGAWVGWPGRADLDLAPFDLDGYQIVPVALSEEEIEEYYEGFSNDTIWPLYHDVIAPPAYHREWWVAYQRVNRRFAEAASEVAAPNATVWVHDYQLQLVPQYLRELRPDLTIGYFHHIPFPSHGLFAQLPWRRQILRGLMGADLLGFQRPSDATNFIRCVGRQLQIGAKAGKMAITEGDGTRREVLAKGFPISIDTGSYAELATRPDIVARAEEIRQSLGNPRKILLGVDRLDYTKGIRHRLKAFGELLREGRIEVGDVTLVQVASPSRERVDAYAQLRDEIELTVGRINGDFDTVSHTAIRYLHQSYPREEMVALCLAADVCLITALRDGMNLVAKEYVAVRGDESGVLVLSEFTGAADELGSAVLINPHDIEGMKNAIMSAISMPAAEQRRRMRNLRKKVTERDVTFWSEDFLTTLRNIAAERSLHAEEKGEGE